jgi:hypothetical protein
VHAAFEAERREAVADLLIAPLLIDAAPLLLRAVEPEAGWQTLVWWAEILERRQAGEDATRLLEDAWASGAVSPGGIEVLRQAHYHAAQGYTLPGATKPEPEIRIRHLRRIVDLGFALDYDVHKQLAEAYHDQGDDDRAREQLAIALRLNPALSGATRINRALRGEAPPRPAARRPSSRPTYTYSREDEIPSIAQIRDWAAILPFADLDGYSPRIPSSTREMLGQIARSLGRWDDPLGVAALTAMLQTVYWDVREACLVSLGNVGTGETIAAIEALPHDNSRVEAARTAALARLRAKGARSSTPASPAKAKTSALVSGSGERKAILQRARALMKTGDFGKALVLLEGLIAAPAPDATPDAELRLLLAKACAGSGDDAGAGAAVKPIFHTLAPARRRALAKGFRWVVRRWLRRTAFRGRSGAEEAVVHGRQRPRSVPVKAAHARATGGCGARTVTSISCPGS